VPGAAVLSGVLRRPVPPSQWSWSTRLGAESERESKREREACGATESVSAVSLFFTGTVYLKGRGVCEREGGVREGRSQKSAHSRSRLPP
jgi:hypothetical protein